MKISTERETIEVVVYEKGCSIMILDLLPKISGTKEDIVEYLI